MRGTQCYRDTMRVVGIHKPTRRYMFLMLLKKLMRVKSPSIGAISAEYKYEYDYLKAKYFGGR